MRRLSPHRLNLITACHWLVVSLPVLTLNRLIKRPRGHVAGSLVCPQPFLQPLQSWNKVVRKRETTSISGPSTHAHQYTLEIVIIV